MVPGAPCRMRDANTSWKRPLIPKNLRLDLQSPCGFLIDQVGQRGHVLEVDKRFLPGQPSLGHPVLDLVGILGERLAWSAPSVCSSSDILQRVQ